MSIREGQTADLQGSNRLYDDTWRWRTNCFVWIN
jgi:hypothetical protein